MKKAKENWIGVQCEEIETCLNINYSKRAYQLLKDLTLEKQGKSSTSQDKSGKCLTEIAVASLKKGKSTAVDNLPAVFVQAGGETMIRLQVQSR